MTQVERDFIVGDWCWFTRQASPCRVIERQDVWGEVAYRVWLPAKDAVVRARAADLAVLESVRSSVEQILHTTAAAKLLDALEDNLLLAPIQSSVVPLPHQLYALNRAISRDRIRYLLADEVGLGKTIEAGLGPARGEVARPGQAHPGGGARGWCASGRRKCACTSARSSSSSSRPSWQPSGSGAAAARRGREPVAHARPGDLLADSVKPLEGRRGWSLEQLNTYNRERFEDLISRRGIWSSSTKPTAWAAAPSRWPATRVRHWPRYHPSCCCRPRRTRARPTSSCG